MIGTNLSTMSLVDLYTLRARVQPALIVILPAGLLVFALLPDHPFFATAFFGLLGAAGGTAIMAQVGRDPGRKKEKALWDSWDGPPTTRLLRHRHIPGDIELEPALRQRFEDWLGYPLPTEQEEEADPELADRKYENAIASLREDTRDRARFPLVFAEVTNYGFRRNLRGTHLVGTSIAVACALIPWVMFALTIHGRPWPEPWWDVLTNPDSAATIRLLVAITNTAFAAFWLSWVRRSWVKIAADRYAKQLLESVRTLRNG